MLIINEGKLHRTNNIIWKSNSTHQIGWNTPWPHPPTFPDWLRRRKSFLFCWPSILTSGLRASGRSSFHRGSEKELKELDPRLLGSKTWWNRSLCSAERKELVEDGQHVTGGYCAPMVNYFLAWIRTRASKQSCTIVRCWAQQEGEKLIIA